ncbi:trihelix transcription factor GTL1 isoform X2 [Corylus avellana]|uniref:trihelix transcription factor GTL1 isoform X2 n=1 Tax=Corylus avellana TaxID=13451 RepID=UPI00286BAE94|nr:trihelix transcription factor GTL1 isoform X2 [Corylus avellana]
MQQGGGGGGDSKSEMSAPALAAAAATGQPMGTESGQAQLVEAASPISSRPPASAAVNLDELMPLQGGTADEDALAAAAGEGGAIGGGNRWPRQETLALLRIRSEMDAVFCDATLKGPLWEDVSRKLAELGYKRSAKKCKEKFENVHKYYKRTKEGRAGRQDGKSYKFFSELEALHSSAASSSATGNNASASFLAPPVTTTTINPVISPVSTGIGIGGFISNAMPISSIRVPHAPPGVGMFPPDPSAAVIAPSAAAAAAAPPPTGISFSSNSSSSSPGSDDEEESLEGEPSNVGSSRKRKRGSSRAGSGSGTRRMMEFFENLMKQVMYKQEVMQQRFLEVIEKRDQDRMIREEAWKRQEMARLAREHELMAQDRAISASRDAAIVAFLQKITGQTVQLPTPTTVTNIPAAPPPTVPAAPTPTPPPPPPPSQQHHHYQQRVHQRSPQNAQVVMAIPEQQVPPQDTSGGGGMFEATSSRWPKAEVLALISLRSGLEPRYQEAGPKGPLWEEISSGMLRIGYKRSAKRCKEKWENINKYYKKVKESNKKRPEDAKTCPYFHQLDALYRKKILGASSSGGSGSGNNTCFNQNRPEQQQENVKLDPRDAPAIMPIPEPQEALASTHELENQNKASTDEQAQASDIGLPAGLLGEGIGAAPKKKTL